MLLLLLPVFTSAVALGSPSIPTPPLHSSSSCMHSSPIPPPSTLHPAARSSNSSAVSLQEQIRRHTSFLSMPAESRGSAGLLRLRCSHLLRPRSGGKRSPTHNPSLLPSCPSLPPRMCSSRCQQWGRRKREREKGGVAEGTNPGAGSGGGAADAQ